MDDIQVELEPYSVAVGIFPTHAIITDFVTLQADGTLTVMTLDGGGVLRAP
jgi:hypothetical protein